jgi:plasmid stabilization system protein ParE
MKRRYILAPDAALDLAHIWRYIKKESSEKIATRIESEIRDKIAFLAQNPGAGHLRKDLTDAPVLFFPVYSYLIVYRPDAKPLEVVSILHAHLDVEGVLGKRMSTLR